MLDIKYIREHKDEVIKAIDDKQLTGTVDIDRLLLLDEQYRNLLRLVEEHRALRNTLSDNIAKVPDTEKQRLIHEATRVKEELTKHETELKTLSDEIENIMLWVPNVPAADVPFGKGENDNVVIRTVGEKPEFNFKPKDHLELGTALNIIDTQRGTKIAGFRGYFLTNEGMLLEQAILKYALDFMVEQGFAPMSVPVMVNKEYLLGTGYFPWGLEDHYYTQDDQALIGTAEVSLTSYYANELLDEAMLPVKLVGLSPCFRREIGSHGKDTKGVFRVHTFNKVEQVVLVAADESESVIWHEKMLSYTEQLLQNLKIHYQVLLMCTGDMGAGQRKKYDINIWFPGQGEYREICSASYFNDFQARRLNMKYKTKDGATKYVYTLNNTVVPTPRFLANLLETYQQEDGSILVPDVLHKYMNGIKKISIKN